MMKMMVVLIGFLLLLTGCASAPKEPVDIQGDWTASVDTYEFDATIQGDLITIDLDLGGMVGLYWEGNIPSEMMDGETFSSEKTDNELLIPLYGEGPHSKDFTLRGDSLVFEFSILGKTQNVSMKRG